MNIAQENQNNYEDKKYLPVDNYGAFDCIGADEHMGASEYYMHVDTESQSLDEFCDYFASCIDNIEAYISQHSRLEDQESLNDLLAVVNSLGLSASYHNVMILQNTFNTMSQTLSILVKRKRILSARFRTLFTFIMDRLLEASQHIAENRKLHLNTVIEIEEVANFFESASF